MTATKPSSIKAFIESNIAKHQVVIFAKSWCPYCDETKSLVADNKFFRGVDVKSIDLDTMEVGPLVQDELYKMTGQRTVPSVWVNGTFVGGNSDTQKAWRSGQLAVRLQQTAGQQ